MSVPTLEITPQWQTYLDLPNDVKPILQIPVGDTTRDSDIQDVVDAACAWVQRYLGRPIAPTTFFRRFSTNFVTAYIMLPYYPVLEVVSVVEYWGANGPQTLSLQTPENQSHAQTYQIKPLEGRLTRTFMGLIPRPWFGGADNVEVEWVAGYNPIPADVRLATKELIRYWWDNTQQASRSIVAPRGVDIDVDVRNPLWPAIPNRVTMWLEPFVQQGLG